MFHCTLAFKGISRFHSKIVFPLILVKFQIFSPRTISRTSRITSSLRHPLLRDIEENSKKRQRALKFVLEASKMIESKKNTIWGPKSNLWGILGVSTPHPPYQKLKGTLTIF